MYQRDKIPFHCLRTFLFYYYLFTPLYAVKLKTIQIYNNIYETFVCYTYNIIKYNLILKLNNPKL